MRVIRQGKGEVAMKEGELAKFFGVSWQKVNHKVRLITAPTFIPIIADTGGTQGC